MIASPQIVSQNQAGAIVRVPRGAFGDVAVPTSAQTVAGVGSDSVDLRVGAAVRNRIREGHSLFDDSRVLAAAALIAASRRDKIWDNDVSIALGAGVTERDALAWRRENAVPRPAVSWPARKPPTDGSVVREARRLAGMREDVAAPGGVQVRLDPRGRPGYRGWLSVDGIEFRIGVDTHWRYVEGHGGSPLPLDGAEFVRAHAIAAAAIANGRSRPINTIILEDVLTALGLDEPTAAREAAAIRRRRRDGASSRLRESAPQEAAPNEAMLEGAPPAPTLAMPYRPVDLRPPAIQREPFTVDPNEIDRATLAHKKTQTHIEEAARARNRATRSPGPDDPNFDLAWIEGDDVTVVEVKTVTPTNEAHQIRLGLGQVLDYQHELQRAWPRVNAVLVLNQMPASPRWFDLCSKHGVKLICAQDVDDLFAPA